MALDNAAQLEQIWLKSYPDGVSRVMENLAETSLSAFFDTYLKKYASRTAFVCMGKAISYAELDASSKAFAAHLQAKGFVKGDRIAIMMPNVLQYPIAMIGILRAGLIVVNVNPLYTPRELEHQLKDSGAKGIILLENFAVTLQQVIAKTDVKHVIVGTIGDALGLKGYIVNFVVRNVKKMVPAWSLPGHTSYKQAIADGKAKSFKPVAQALSDVAFLQYTGGTTGVSKGATLTHSNILSNITQSKMWLDVGYRKGGKPDTINFICALPLYHIFALTVNAFIGIKEGGTNILITNPRDIPGFVKELQKVDFHFFPGLNTLFTALMNNDDFKKLNFSNLRMTFGGGMAIQKPVADKWQKLTGCVITQGYGLSETSPVATGMRLDEASFTGNIGYPMPSTTISIRDENGDNVALGEVGEICIKGPQVMAGYWNRDDETAKVMSADGFFRSGDMGYIDEIGATVIVDRKKDMILVSGFNVYPNEVEEVAVMHDGILEAAAVGVADEHSGEVVKLFVVKKDPNLTEQDVKDHCAKNLTNYKRPKFVEFRNDLPKTNVGKILRRELR
ncbi:MAG: long-chain-fatty-acid--CoA ligase [Ahrensia sp.]|nr:long-chain-fatty-acid--CoA ligase [Ahrensia sp.]